MTLPPQSMLTRRARWARQSLSPRLSEKVRVAQEARAASRRELLQVQALGLAPALVGAQFVAQGQPEVASGALLHVQGKPPTTAAVRRGISSVWKVKSVIKARWSSRYCQPRFLLLSKPLPPGRRGLEEAHSGSSGWLSAGAPPARPSYAAFPRRWARPESAPGHQSARTEAPPGRCPPAHSTWICRDTTSYLNIRLDDNKNKLVCRLWRNGARHCISFFSETKKDVKTRITGLDDLYKFSDQLICHRGAD